MTFVGKVLIVLQVVLSLLFMAFAGAVFSVQTNWKTKVTDNLKVINELKETQTTIETDHAKALDDLAAKLVLTEDRAKNAEANLQDQTDKAKSLSQQLENESTRASALEQNIKIANTQAEERRNEAIALRGINSKLHKIIGQMVAEVRVLEEGKFVSARERDLMVVKQKRLIKDFSQLQRIVAIEEIDINAYEGKKVPPVNIEGKVLATRKGKRSEPDLIEISLGEDDDLVKGHELFCYSKADDGKYLGKIRIVYVTPDKSVGVVIQKAKNGIIKEGDYVSPKL